MIVSIDSISLRREVGDKSWQDYVVVYAQINGKTVELIREAHTNYFDHTIHVGGIERAVAEKNRTDVLAAQARTSPKGASSSLHDGTDRDSRKENAK